MLQSLFSPVLVAAEKLKNVVVEYNIVELAVYLAPGVLRREREAQLDKSS